MEQDKLTNFQSLFIALKIVLWYNSAIKPKKGD